MSQLVVIGTGGMGREAAAWVADAGRGGDLVGFLDDDRALHGRTIAHLPVLGDRAWLDGRDVEVVIGLGVPAVRAAVLADLDARGILPTTVVHPTAVVGPRTSIGAGSIVCPGVVMTCDVTLGRCVIVNYGALLGHDVAVGDCAFVAPGAHVAGAVTIGDRADVGIGSSIIQGLRVGEDAVVGAGAVVIHDVPPSTTVVGVPARPLPREGTRP